MIAADARAESAPARRACTRAVIPPAFHRLPAPPFHRPVTASARESPARKHDKAAAITTSCHPPDSSAATPRSVPPQSVPPDGGQWLSVTRWIRMSGSVLPAVSDAGSHPGVLCRSRTDPVFSAAARLCCRSGHTHNPHRVTRPAPSVTRVAAQD